MSKLTLFLALYAAVASTVLLTRGSGAARAPAARTSVLDAGNPGLRKVMAEARALLRSEVKGTLKNIDWRLSRMDALSKAMQAGLQATQQMAEASASANYGKLESLEEVVQGFAKATSNLAALRARYAALEERLKTVEDRPPQVVREVVRQGPDPKAAAGHPREGPKKHAPRLPLGERSDPKVVAAEIAKARLDLASDALDVVFPAIEKIREHRVMEAVPRLIEIMGTFKAEFGRAAAATALGNMKAADAVPALADALVDKSGLVAQQANKSLIQITGFDTQLPASAGIRKRRALRGRIKEWWRGHEAEVRTRLDQPRPGGG